MLIRYEDMRADRALVSKYEKQLEEDIKKIRGENDIKMLLDEFERTFSAYIGTRHAIAVNSGSDALHLSLMAIGVKKGDSVIIPNLTYPAVALSVIYAGAQPILVDVDKNTLQMDPGLLEKHIRNNTRAIIAVHMFSYPCEIEKILEIARKRKIHVIEDCCQAESSEYNGKKVGSFGELSCFSFSYYKPLSSCGGGGGMVCFNDKKFKKILDYTKVTSDDAGLSDAGKRFPRMYLMDMVAIKTKFRYLKEILRSRKDAKKIYDRELAEIKHISSIKSSRHMTVIPQNYILLTSQRDALWDYLQENGITCQRAYTPLNQASLFNKFSHGAFPNSDSYNKNAMHLPLFSFIKKEECLFITEKIRSFFA